jgi:probable rRNA maturation factor
MTAAPRARLKIDVMVDAAQWRKSANLRSVVRRAIAQAAAVVPTAGRELAIVLTDDSAIRKLNRLWRGIDAATNVLSFPSKQRADEPPHLGDIVLAYQTIMREAHDEKKPLAHHVAHLVVHGYLHLVGYDHKRRAPAEAMEAIERNILGRLAVPDPYRPEAAKRRTPKRRKKSRTLPRIPA